MDMIVSTGHGEYLLPLTPGVTVRELWSPMSSDDGSDIYETETDAAESFTEHHGFPFPGDADLTWECVVRVTGDPAAIRQAFDALVAELDTVPSGDDDAFDYWPSGVRLAGQIAEHLGGTATDDLHRVVARAFAQGTAPHWTAGIVNLGGLTISDDDLIDAVPLREGVTISKISDDPEWELFEDAPGFAGSGAPLRPGQRPLGTILPLKDGNGTWRVFRGTQDGVDRVNVETALNDITARLDVNIVNGTAVVEGPDEIGNVGFWVDVELDSPTDVPAFLAQVAVDPRATMVRCFREAYGDGGMVEAVCTVCGETYLPADADDVEHAEDRGLGIVAGAWLPPARR